MPAVLRPEESHGQKLLIRRTGRPFLIAGKGCLPKSVRSDLEHRRRMNSTYVLVVNWSKECTTWVAAGSHLYVFYSNEENAKLY